MRIPAGFLLPLALLTLTACASTAPVAAPSSSSAVPTATTSSTPTSSTPTPKTTAPPPPAPAANGSDVQACKQATCEILVSGTVTVPLAAKFGVHELSLAFVAPNRINFTMIRTKMAYVRGYIAGAGHLSFANGMSFDVERVDAAGAVLRFTPKTDNPHSDTGNSSEGLGIFGSG